MSVENATQPRTIGFDPGDDDSADDTSTPTWRHLASPDHPPASGPPSDSRILVRVLVAAAIVLVAVGAVGSWATRATAEAEGWQEAMDRTDLIAESVIAPALDDGLWSDNPEVRDASAERLDDAVTGVIDGDRISSIKVWADDGTVLWSDDVTLIGRRFDLPDLGLDADTPRGMRSSPDEGAPEHQILGEDEQLLEVFRLLEGPSGRPVLVETHSTDAAVEARAWGLWGGFSALSLVALLALTAVLLPLVWHIMRRAQAQREALLRRSVDASRDERRRISGELHDGVVQELAATTLSIDDLAIRADRSGDRSMSRDLSRLARRVRRTAGAQRALLGDLYPPALGDEGLARALDDAAAPVRVAGTRVVISVPEDVVRPLSLAQQELVRRVAEEMLRNIAKHASARTARVRVRQRDGRVVLEVSDDGVGFDPDRMRSMARGHLGTRVLCDLARDEGAELMLRTAEGAGTTWRLVIEPRTD